ncbi:glutathione S-transferase 2-like [Spodoptera frugiperda]|uniref:glutathione transferase n=1 Tax=Spodoptera frugiperda TaxID=7108 RepID=A0A9R0DME1_SPOFR|nr:glutathione S-transferase 2-like [Spodoptera frugiperda]
MPKYVFHYFNGKGLGEPVRLLLAFGDEGFEDHRVAFNEWTEFKPKTPFGQMPFLEFDGKQYAQSLSLARYLGNKYDLGGDTLEDALEIDQNVDLIHDLLTKGIIAYHEEDEAVKEKKYAEFNKDVFPNLLEKLNEIITKNNGHVALGKLTWGDFVFVGWFDYIKDLLVVPDLEKKYPVFQKVVDAVYSIPKVKTYADAVGPTEF